jgi:hypothetical protein
MKKMLGMVLLCGICLFGCQNETDKIVDEYEDLGYTITYEVEEELIEKTNRMSVHLNINVEIDEGTHNSYEREQQIFKDLMIDLSEHFYEEYGERYENQHYSSYYVWATIHLNGSDEPLHLSHTEDESIFLF